MARGLAAALLGCALAVPSHAQVYWWKFPASDCPQQMDIGTKQPGSVTVLETDCLNTAGCAAFNSNGWLKTTQCTPDAVATGQTCDLYIKSDKPQPSPTQAPTRPINSLWPLPVSITFGAANFTVSPSMTFVATTPSPDLAAAFARIQPLIFTHGAANVGQLQQLTVTVADVNVPLQLGVDESYTLDIPATGGVATLTAPTVYGAYHGLQTFSQLVQWSFDTQSYGVMQAPISVKDAPRFKWRGILIDTDRHFLPLSTIFLIIDSLSYSKQNTLHWHIVDEQAWPLQSIKYPLLWSAAWSPSERYTLRDVADVVEYGRLRGVRIVPEFDTPGHAGSVCKGYVGACPSASCTMPLNPAHNITFDLIQTVLSEIAAVTPDAYFHLGGDEVDTTCWTSTPEIVTWMADHGLTADQTYEYMVTQVDAMSFAMNKIPIRWEEVWKHFGTALDPRTIIHAWLSTATVIDASSKGYAVIWSVDGVYYLDALNEDWHNFYDTDILAGVTNVTAQQLVIGGETEMWGETADPSDVLQTIYPRAAAAAEAWWSYDVMTNSSDPQVEYRLQDFRCLLHRRGVAAAPVTNKNARSAPSGPGSCQFQ